MGESLAPGRGGCNVKLALSWDRPSDCCLQLERQASNTAFCLFKETSRRLISEPFEGLAYVDYEEFEGCRAASSRVIPGSVSVECRQYR